MTAGEALSQKLEQWLQAVGFVKGNPFATINAEDLADARRIVDKWSDARVP